MKFCLITTFFPPYHFGGDATYVADLASALVSTGHEVTVVHCADSFELLRGPAAPAPYPLHPAVRVHTLRSRWGRLSPVITYFTGHPGPKAAALARILSQGFDVVHWHNLSLIGPAALTMAQGMQLYTFHEYWLFCPTSLLFRYDREVCTRRTCLRCLLAHKRPPPLWRATGLLGRWLRRLDGFIAYSRCSQKLIEDSPLRIQVRYLPPFLLMPRGATRPPDEKPYYLFVGRLIRAKGLQTVLGLFARTGRPLWVAGAGSLEPELRRIAAGQPNIRFLGHVRSADLPALYAGARATLVPSVCPDVAPRVTLESLQQGTPLIGSPFGGIPEIIQDTGGGWVYRSLEELESLLDRIDAHPEEARKAEVRGQEAAARYTAENHLREYLAVIEEIRAARAAKGAIRS
ncbi:MAG: glycosyltransferase [Bryobacteraceae bacterium]|nr:glycosyltransferase [Bryobacteraceae bacterium]